VICIRDDRLDALTPAT